ncbi:MAG: hypothetical protein ACOYXT_16800 [Bacteroidota bacterium]
MIQTVNKNESIRQSLVKAILIAGLIAGTLDIIAAIVQTILNGRDPMTMLKFIASGVFGKEALQAGSQFALLGLFFHYCIATGWGILLFLIYPKIKFFSKNWIVTGVAYGFFVWLMMNRVVLPLSNTPPLPFKFGWNMVKSALIIVTCVGLPLSYLATKHYNKLKADNSHEL